MSTWRHSREPCATRLYPLCLAVLLCSLACRVGAVARSGRTGGDWESWLENFGHDSYRYPAWVLAERERCTCTVDTTLGAQRMSCRDNQSHALLRGDSLGSGGHAHRGRGLDGTGDALTWCVAKQWLIDHMPDFDKAFMPPSVSVDGQSMFDDNIAFTLMVDNASTWMRTLPLDLRLTYVLPYASYHESRVNWRPIFFAKFFQLVADADSASEAMARLIAPNVFLNWTGNAWDSRPHLGGQTDYSLAWSSSTSPPVIDPFSFAAYGYGSCTAWSTLVTYIARAVGIPARQVGTPCWNSVFEGTDFRGLARDNSNVSLCWHAGIGSKTGARGGGFLNNHNWVEWWDAERSGWVFQNVPPESKDPNSASLCPGWALSHGCGYNASAPAGEGCAGVQGGPGAAAQDHEIFAVSWSAPTPAPSELDGGPVLDAASLRLSSGEAVSPLVWSPSLASPLGAPLKDVGLRLVNRTSFYRCKEQAVPSADELVVSAKLYDLVVDESRTVFVVKQSAVAADLDAGIAKSKRVLFMEGTPDAPKSELSRNVLKILTQVQAVPFVSVDALAHPAVLSYTVAKNSRSRLPHLYLDGRFFADHDGLLAQYRSGELAKAIGTESTTSRGGWGDELFVATH